MLTELTLNRVYGYQRVSSIQQTEGNSLEAQGKQIQAYAASKGWDVPDTNIFTEAGISGSIDFKERPEGARLLQTVKSGDTITVHSGGSASLVARARSPMTLAASRRGVRYCAAMLASSVTRGSQEQLREAIRRLPAKTGTEMAPNRSGESKPSSDGSRVA